MASDSSYILDSIEYVNRGKPMTEDIFADAAEVNQALAETARSIHNAPEVPGA
jgi:hypothetical protein